MGDCPVCGNKEVDAVIFPFGILFILTPPVCIVPNFRVHFLQLTSLLERFGMKASMSRKGTCYDNAPMESFWGTLKSEIVYHSRYTSRREAMQEITEYIEIFYNRQRRQERLGYLSPASYEQQFYERGLIA